MYLFREQISDEGMRDDDVEQIVDLLLLKLEFSDWLTLYCKVFEYLPEKRD